MTDSIDESDGTLSGRRAARRATETALMEAALRLLRRDGVLAGLSFKEVADEAGVNRALVHRYFGSQRALLRAALNARKDGMAAAAHSLPRLDPVERLAVSFPSFAEDPSYPEVVMLLALDGDDDFAPMPYFAERLAASLEEQEAGVLRQDADLLAVTVIFDVLLYAYFVMRTSLAHQLAVPVTTLDARVRTELDRVVATYVSGEGTVDS